MQVCHPLRGLGLDRMGDTLWEALAVDKLRVLVHGVWASACAHKVGQVLNALCVGQQAVWANKKAVDQKSTACDVFDLSSLISLVPRRGLEPPRCYSLVPETSASTNSAIWASQEDLNYRGLEQPFGLSAEKEVKIFSNVQKCVKVITMKKAECFWPSALVGVICLRWCPEEDSNLHDVTR